MVETIYGAVKTRLLPSFLRWFSSLLSRHKALKNARCLRKHLKWESAMEFHKIFRKPNRHFFHLRHVSCVQLDGSAFAVFVACRQRPLRFPCPQYRDSRENNLHKICEIEFELRLNWLKVILPGRLSFPEELAGNFLVILNQSFSTRTYFNISLCGDKFLCHFHIEA